MADLTNISKGVGYILTDIYDYILVGANEDETLIFMDAPELTNINKN